MTKQIDELDRNGMVQRYADKTRKQVEDGEKKTDYRAAGRLMAGKKRWGGTGGIPAAKVSAVTREEVEEFEVNENLENILVHAWNKDAVNLRDALDSEMQSRISDHVDSMVADVSARLFVPANSTDNEG